VIHARQECIGTDDQGEVCGWAGKQGGRREESETERKREGERERGREGERERGREGEREMGLGVERGWVVLCRLSIGFVADGMRMMRR
jgi:hypothetical protein